MNTIDTSVVKETLYQLSTRYPTVDTIHIDVDHFMYPDLDDDGGYYGQAYACGIMTSFPFDQMQFVTNIPSVIISIHRPYQDEDHSKWYIYDPHLVTYDLVESTRLLGMVVDTDEEQCKIQFVMKILTTVLEWDRGFIGEMGDQQVDINRDNGGFIAIAETCRAGIFKSYPVLNGCGAIYSTYKSKKDGKPIFLSRVESWGYPNKKMREEFMQVMSFSLRPLTCFFMQQHHY